MVILQKLNMSMACSLPSCVAPASSQALRLNSRSRAAYSVPSKQPARVLTCLDHEPDGERLVVVLVRRDAELQRVDAMAVRACLVQIGPQRRIDLRVS